MLSNIFHPIVATTIFLVSLFLIVSLLADQSYVTKTIATPGKLRPGRSRRQVDVSTPFPWPGTSTNSPTAPPFEPKTTTTTTKEPLTSPEPADSTTELPRTTTTTAGPPTTTTTTTGSPTLTTTEKPTPDEVKCGNLVSDKGVPFLVAVYITGIKEEQERSRMGIRMCPGLIVEEKIVLVTFSCLIHVKYRAFHDIQVIASESQNYTYFPQKNLTLQRTRATLCPNFDYRGQSGQYMHNFAALYLRKAIKMSENIKPVCLPSDQNLSDYEAKRCKLVEIEEPRERGYPTQATDILPLKVQDQVMRRGPCSNCVHTCARYNQPTFCLETERSMASIANPEPDPKNFLICPSKDGNNNNKVWLVRGMSNFQCGNSHVFTSLLGEKLRIKQNIARCKSLEEDEKT